MTSVLLAGGLAGCIGDGDGNDDEPLDPTAGPPGSGHMESDSADASITVSTGALGMCLAGPVSEQVLETRPGNLTGILLELTWETVTRDLGLGQLRLNATVDGAPVNSTASPAENGTLRMWVTPDAWETGVLEAHYCADGQAMLPNAVLDGQATLHTTVFTGGTPDWGFSAS